MTKPYIDTYENQNGDIVLVYIEEVNVGEQVEPSYIVIKKDHVDEVFQSIKEFIGG